MKMEARKRQGSRTNLTSTPVESKLRTDEAIGNEVGEIRSSIFELCFRPLKKK